MRKTLLVDLFLRSSWPGLETDPGHSAPLLSPTYRSTSWTLVLLVLAARKANPVPLLERQLTSVHTSVSASSMTRTEYKRGVTLVQLVAFM